MSEHEQERPQYDFMHKLALQIVERRNLVFLIVVIGAIFTLFSRNWVVVESDLTTYPAWGWTSWTRSLRPTARRTSWWPM